MESVCQQNGTWTSVELSCVRDPAIPDPVGALDPKTRLGDGASGVYLIAGGPGGGGGGRAEGWTMLAVSVVVAVILGTAVAFLILLVRRW